MKFSEVPTGATFTAAGIDRVWMRISRTHAMSPETRGAFIPDPDTVVELVALRTSTRCRFEDLEEGEQFTLSRKPGQVYEREGDIGANMDTGDALLVDEGEMVDTLVERKHNPGLSVDYWIHDKYRRAFDTRDTRELRKNEVNPDRLIADLIDRITELENSRQQQADAHLDDLNEIREKLHQTIKEITT